LVKGNHDKLKNYIYIELGLTISELQLTIHPFTFIHQPVTRNYDLNIDNYFISGHVHPVVKFNLGKAQCFCFGKTQAIIPAFSNSVRNTILNVDTNSRIYITNGDFVRYLESGF
jgi:metallophosphoesterase superfamily enzyme